MSPSSPGITCPSPSIKCCPACAALPLPEWSWATTPPPGASSSPTLGLGLFFFFSEERGTGQQPPLQAALGSLQISVCLPSSPPCPGPALGLTPWVHPSPVSALSAPTALLARPVLPLLLSPHTDLCCCLSRSGPDAFLLPPPPAGGLPPSALSPSLRSVPGPAEPTSSLRFLCSSLFFL